ncbi:MAG: hypothetical protein JWM84_1441, partial [Nocardioides sp.]|nr:hypothetical protein [Nocardioides sp.]
GAKPARPGTPGGGAVFFVSNDRTGTMLIRRSRLIRNPSRGFETQGLPGIFFLGAPANHRQVRAALILLDSLPANRASAFAKSVHGWR